MQYFVCFIETKKDNNNNIRDNMIELKIIIFVI